MRRRMELALAGWAVGVAALGGIVAVTSTTAVSTSAEPLVSACVTLQIVDADPLCIVI